MILRVDSGQGYGKAIFKELLHQGYLAGVGYIFLTATKKGEALYRNMGFKDVSSTDDMEAMEFWWKDYDAVLGKQ